MAHPIPAHCLAGPLLWALLLTTTGCSTPPPLTARPEQTALAPGCVVALRVDLQIWGHRDRVLVPIPNQSRTASEQAFRRLANYWSDRAVQPVQDSPVLREHLALYDLVAGESLRHPKQSLSATLGPGLQGIVGCPFGVVLQGAQFPHGGRRSPLLSLGLVEIASGQVLWLKALADTRFDTPARLGQALNRLLEGMPP